MYSNIVGTPYNTLIIGVIVSFIEEDNLQKSVIVGNDMTVVMTASLGTDCRKHIIIRESMCGTLRDQSSNTPTYICMWVYMYTCAYLYK